MAKFILSAFADEASASLDEQIATLKALGISHIEPRNVDGTNVSDLTEEAAKAVRKKLDDAGIGLSSIGSPIGKVDIAGDLDKHIEKLKNTINVANILGAKYIRMFSFFVPVGHEDEYETQVFAGMERLMERFAPELGFAFDPSNFVQCEQDTKAGFPRLKKYLTYMHMKDSKFPSNAEREHRDMGFEGVSDAHRPVGQGDGNVSWIIDQLIDMNYEGFMTIEPHLTNCALVPGTPVDKFNAAAHALIDLIESKGQSWE